MKKQVVIYCMTCSAIDFKDLPWDRMTFFNHAFWQIAKEENKFVIVPCYPEYDFGPLKNNFETLKLIHKKYPNVNIMLSVGGAGFCRYYSEMALTLKSRKTFIDSCIETLVKYPFLSGIDIDWEFPGISYKKNNGCIKAGNDKKNYPLLLKEMRAAFDLKFGNGNRKITVCAPSGEILLSRQGIKNFQSSVDLINIMSYDLDGCKRHAGHHSPIYSRLGKQSADKAAKIFKRSGTPSNKIVIGSPLYSHGCKLSNVPKDGKVIGEKGSHKEFEGIMMYRDIKIFEDEAVNISEIGWHRGYDEKTNGAYLWNDDVNSKYFKYYISYESEKSLKQKIEYIKSNNYGGIIVWQADGDVHNGFPMISKMAKGLIKK
ncbi:MAG: glycosyl hydrolase family 18 protein [Oscillospiraceae bacterium]